MKTTLSMKSCGVKLVTLACWLMLLQGPAAYAAPASGEFVATQPCDLYQSKRKGTNPGGLRTKVAERYPIIEVLSEEGVVTWVRVKTGIAPQPDRWVAAQCGELLNVEQRPARSAQAPAGASCQLANQFDANVLAVSWQPAFCEVRGGDKQECTTLSQARFDASHFTLHGLWPNRQSCGRRYGYCGVVKEKPSSFCAYPALTLEPELRQALGVVMPSASAGTCLQRHEWWKHGTCSGLSENDYFSLSLALVKQVNESLFVSDFIAPNIGQRVTRDEFEKAFNKSFGRNAYQRVALQCSQGLLTELQIALPQTLEQGSQLTDLLQVDAVPTNGSGSCGARFIIDAAPQ